MKGMCKKNIEMPCVCGIFKQQFKCIYLLSRNDLASAQIGWGHTKENVTNIMVIIHTTQKKHYKGYALNI